MATKVCTKCGPPAQTLDNFALRSRSKGTYSAVCRLCQREYGKQHYQANKASYIAKARLRTKSVRQAAREYVLEYLRSHPCADCGESDPVVLEFDHQHSKKTDVGNLIRAAVALEVLKAEIEKCQVVCANCHKRRTAKTYNWYKSLANNTRP